MSSLKYWVWLSSLSGVGAVTAGALLRQFGTPESVFYAAEKDYIGIEGVKKSDIPRLMKKDINPANKILADCARINCRVLTLQDSEYPDRLKNIYDPPIVLYINGALPIIDDEPVVSIVGTRRCTPYGIKSAEKLGYDLSSRGIIVITGLARGVDTAATRGALRGGSPVLGVIGCGLDVIYPPENGSIYDETAHAGAVISEYPPGSPPVPPHFPMRNRILSGMSLGITVIEAPKKSGALITASRALEQGRDVFVVPGNVDAATCEGSNALLREGATPILSGEDIINEYADLYPDKIQAGKRAKNRSSYNSNQENSEDNHFAVNLRNQPGRGPAANTYSGNDNILNRKNIDNAIKMDYIDVAKLTETLTGDEKAVAEAIGSGSLHVDEIIAKTKLPVHQVLSALTMLEINAIAISDGSKFFRLQNVMGE